MNIAPCRLPPAACRLPPAACRLPPAACHLNNFADYQTENIGEKPAQLKTAKKKLAEAYTTVQEKEMGSMICSRECQSKEQARGNLEID